MSIESECKREIEWANRRRDQERDFTDAAREYMAAESIGTKLPPDMERTTRAAIALIKCYRRLIEIEKAGAVSVGETTPE